MGEKNTRDLTQDLMTESNLDAYLRHNRAVFVQDDLTDQLNKLISRSALTKAEVARRSGISEVYLYQVTANRRRPSRDRLLCICITLEASLEEIQQLLKCADYAPLYPKHRRDAIISHGIIHGTPLSDINEKLFRENEKSLY